MLSINADDEHVLGELVSHGTSVGDILVVAGLSADRLEPDAVAENFEIVVVLLIKQSLELTERRRLDWGVHVGVR
jgi:hypothetical protein